MVTLSLAGQTVRHRFTSFAASFVAIALSAFLVTVCGGLLETGLRGDVPPQRLLTAPIVVTGVQSYWGETLPERDRVSASLATAIAAVPGVARTVPDVSFPVTVLRGGQPAAPPVEGHGWSSAQLTPYRLAAGRAPAAPGEVVLDQRLADRLRLSPNSILNAQAGGTVTAWRVVGLAKTATAQAPAVFVTDTSAQALLGHVGRVDSIAVYPSRGSAVSAVAGRITGALAHGAPPQGSVMVLTGAARGKAEFPAAAGQSADLIPLAAVAGGLMTMVAVFIVASTLALSVQLRRRQIALLRAVGAAPGQLRRLVLSETLLVAAPAVAVGLIPTEPAGRRLLAAFAQHGLAAERLVYHQSFIPTLAGAGVAVLTALAAALVAARGALRVRPVEALSADDTPQRWLNWPRLVFGLLTLAGAVALAVVTALVFDGPIAASTAAPSAMLWAISLSLLAPAVTRPVVALLGRIAAVLAPRTGHLTMLTVRGRGARTAAMITPVMLATGLTSSLLYMQTSLQAATDHAYAQHLRAGLVLTSAAGGIPLSAAARISRLPGVAAASPLVTSSGFFNVPPGADPENVDSIPLEGLDGPAASRVTSYPVTAGSLGRLTGDSIAIPAGNAGPGRELGDTVTLRFGDNTTARLRIVAVFTSRRGYPLLLLPAGLLAEHTSTGLASQVLVAAAPHTSLTSLEQRVRRSAPGIEVSNRETALAAFSAQQQTGAWVNYLFIAALIAFVTVSLISTTVAGTARRRPQLQMLRRIGANRGQVTRAMTIEAVLVAGAGIALGTLVALATLLPFDSALGVPGLPAGPWWIYLTVTAAAAAVTVLVTRLSAQLLRTGPAQV
jgi:putative ABC transport system permease protein